MSTTTTTPAKSKPTKKDKKRETSDKAHPGSERLKSVVRRLPPNLPEDVFWGSVAPWVTDDVVAWKTYYPGKLKKRFCPLPADETLGRVLIDWMNKENIPSRAYIAFKNEEQLTLFGREYDGHLFRDKAGNEYQAVVEFAPYQKVPSDKKKVDARNATIEKERTDEDYLSFIASLKAAEAAEPPTLEALLLAAQPAPPPKTTPLLEALKAEKSAHKDKEAILRSHAHYKDATILTPPSRADAKKKGGASSAPPAKPTPAPEASTSKKGKKAQASAPAQGGSKQPPQPQIPAKPAPGPSSANTEGGQGAKTPKRPRPPKPAKQPQPQPPKPAAAAPPPPVIATSASASAPAPAAPPPTTPRRSRPVIGLASRQFEAALSGVAGGGGRARREQAQQAAKEGGDSAATAPPPASGDAASKAPAPRARQPKDKDGEGAPPKILQTPAAQTASEGTGQSHGDGRGGRRGRGRGGGGGGRGGGGGGGAGGGGGGGAPRGGGS
ncbi:hypothetical protein DXG01_003025 [Tephrocybe rancida]|nr:hypothetical protein DXG01_003025 [Tephrocybe rancida]